MTRLIDSASPVPEPTDEEVDRALGEMAKIGPYEEMRAATPPGPYRDTIPVIELGRPMEIRWSEGEWTRGILAGIGWDAQHEAYRISLRDVERSSDGASVKGATK